MDDTKKESENKQKVYDADEYELQLPENGWAYVVAIAVTTVLNVTCQPMCAFGLIFGKFLSEIGDETTGTTLANGMFNTVFSFTGLAANHLLQKYSVRTVGFLGAITFFVGTFATIFITDLIQLVIFFGIVQGVGFGLLLPSSFSTLNIYFTKKLNLITGLSQAMAAAATIVFPYLANYSMDLFGFRGTLALLAALSLHAIPSVYTFQPVQWHMVKKPKSLETTANDEKLDTMESLINEKMEEGIRNRYQKYINPETRPSLTSLGDRAMSVIAVDKLTKSHKNKKSGIWKSLFESLDLTLLKDISYLNLSIGMSFSFISDISFISVLPVNLNMFSSDDIADIVTVFFTSDFVSRLILSAFSEMYKVQNKHIFLCGTIFSIVFRFGFIANDSYIWKMSMCAALGFMRCLIQTPMTLIFAEVYPDDFESSFSLFMVIFGIITLVFGPLMSWVKHFTGSDVMVLHLLTLAYILNVIMWFTEIFIKMCKRKSSNTNDK